MKARRIPCFLIVLGLAHVLPMPGKCGWIAALDATPKNLRGPNKSTQIRAVAELSRLEHLRIRAKLIKNRYYKSHKTNRARTGFDRLDEALYNTFALMDTISSIARKEKRVDTTKTKTLHKNILNINTLSKELLLHGELTLQQELKLSSRFMTLANILIKDDTPKNVSQALIELEGMAKDAEYREKLPLHQTATEIEFPVTPKSLELLVTDDGTLKPLLGDKKSNSHNENKLPEFLLKIPPKERTIQKWEDLDVEQRASVIDYTVNSRNIEITKPAIFGLKVAKTHKKNEVDTSYVDVDIATPVNWRNKVENLEIKRRARGLASENLHESFEKTKVLGKPREDAHLHTPAKIPQKIVDGDPAAQLALTDWYRRLNTYLELIALQEGYAISKNHTNDLIYFDSLKGEDLISFQTFLWLHSRPDVKKVVANFAQFKMSLIGFRDGGSYDGWPDFGFETRHMPADPEVRSAFVDAVQRGLLSEDYGVPYSYYQSMLKNLEYEYPELERNSDEQNAVLGNAMAWEHYNIPLDFKFDDAHPT